MEVLSLVPDSVTLGPLLPLRGCSQAGSLPFVLDFVHLALPLFLKSAARAELALLALDSVQTGFSSFPHQLARAGFLLLVLGTSCMDFSPSVLDVCEFGPPSPLQGLARPDLLMLVPDFGSLGSPLLLRGMV